MEHENKHIKDLVDKLMSEEALETPSLNFTDKVMDEVMSISESKQLVYKPLISKGVWAIIAIGVLSIIAYVSYSEPTINQGWFSRLGLSELKLNPLEGVSFNFSSVFIYAMACLVLMLGIQIPLLKNYFDKRMVF